MRVFEGARRLPMVGAQVDYVPGFLDARTADETFERLLKELRWEQHHVRIAGKQIPSPRLSAWYGDEGLSYAYSGMRLRAAGWTPTLTALRERLRGLVGHEFNTVLANRYRTGSDSMGVHADDEPELGPRPVIASVSLGAVRRFSLSHRTRKDVEPQRIDLEHGSLLLMSEETQSHWRHGLSKTKKPVGERINLTFRQILTTA
jgi:alkylated DNA repair dioxygenase AlkB